MIWKVYNDEDLMTEARKLAAYLAVQPTIGISLIKRALDASGAHDLDQQLDLERDLQAQAGRTPDYMLGFAWQHGLVPVSLSALLRAIELNGVAVERNRQAFAWGRIAAADPDFLPEASATKKPRRWTRSSPGAPNSSPPIRTMPMLRAIGQS